MEQAYTAEKTFDKINFKENPLPKGDYENCRFIGCDLSDTDLSGCKFSDCEFISCNLSLAKLHKTAFQDIKFKDCKMLGLQFYHCSEFGISFTVENCLLNHSSFYKMKIKKTVFKNSHLQETDFTACDLTGSLFDACDLANATFDNTILEKADLRTAYNYSINPEINKIKKAKFSLSGVPGLLHQYDIEIDN